MIESWMDMDLLRNLPRDLLGFARDLLSDLLRDLPRDLLRDFE